MNTILTIAFLLISALYVPLNRRASRYYWSSWFDAYIPLVPMFVVPYLLFFPFVGLSIAYMWDTRYITSMLVALTLAKIMVLPFWYLYPNGVKRPEVPEDRRLRKLLLTIYHYDGETNAFPSSHVFFSLICSFFLAKGFPSAVLLIWIGASTIAISTVFTKQHNIVDVYGGVIVFVLSVFLTHLFGLPVFL